MERSKMEFNRYLDTWGAAKKINLHIFKDREECWDWNERIAEEIGNAFCFRKTQLERRWTAKDKPYYNLYPAILPMLISLKLDIPCSLIKGISVEPLEVRLPTAQSDGPLSWCGETGEQHSVKTVLFGIQPMPKQVDSDELINGLTICFDIGEKDEMGLPVMSFKFFPLREDLTIEDAAKLFPSHESATIGLVVPESVVIAVIKLCACLALIDQDSEIISPDILAKHVDRWGNASAKEREEMAAMAQRRGKNGWNVGAGIEYVPHYRRPHLALVRVGKGRTLKRIVMRSGAVVHRAKLAEIPSGYDSESDTHRADD